MFHAGWCPESCGSEESRQVRSYGLQVFDPSRESSSDESKVDGVIWIHEVGEAIRWWKSKMGRVFDYVCVVWVVDTDDETVGGGRDRGKNIGIEVPRCGKAWRE